jgi:cold shock CspA family protein
MRQQGTLCKWNEERGFGFIKPYAGGSDIFVHISSFPKHIELPTIGESVFYQIAIRSGKPQAIDVRTQDHEQSRHVKTRYNSRKKTSSFGLIALVFLLLVLIAIVYFKFFGHAQTDAPIDAVTTTTSNQRTDAEIRQAIRDSLNGGSNSRPSAINTLKPAAVSSNSKCDGRTHCSQMTSCAEATYFLQNCPGVQMDGGDQDGVPCESQWCGD